VLIIAGMGIMVGAIAGYVGGWVDNLLMRVVDVILSLPFLFLVLLIVSFFGLRDVRVVIIAIGITGWTTAARLIRAEFLSIRETDYAQAARALGVGHGRIILRHLLPGAMAPLVVACALGVADSVITESALSFLGFGVAPPEVSLGQMLNNAREYFFQSPERILYPGVMLVTIVLCASFLGDGLRDALDPRQKVEG
jgi:peptide/nickel transport system permease protein